MREAASARFSREESFAVDGAPVLNGLPVALAAAETAVGLRRLNGTGTSRRAAYALPPSEAVTEFLRTVATGPQQDGPSGEQPAD